MLRELNIHDAPEFGRMHQITEGQSRLVLDSYSFSYGVFVGKKLVAVCSGKPMRQHARRPVVQDGGLELSYEVDPEHRRLGYGTIVVRTALLMKRVPMYLRIVPDNEASLGLAAKLGFREIWRESHIVVFEHSVPRRFV